MRKFKIENKLLQQANFYSGQEKYNTFKENNEYFNYLTKVTIKCSCGHSITLDKGQDREICTWCNKFVYKDKKTEFKYKFMIEKRRIENGNYYN